MRDGNAGLNGGQGELLRRRRRRRQQVFVSGRFSVVQIPTFSHTKKKTPTDAEISTAPTRSPELLLNA